MKSILIIIFLTISQDDKIKINKILDNLHYYASIADGDKYFKLFDTDGVFLGTDATERWTVNEFKDYALKRFESGTGWTYYPINRNIYLNNNKNTAWFDEELSNEKYGVFRGTGVLIKTDEGWKISQYNLLLPIPNELLIDYSKEIKLFLKKEE
jgi:hypothetical protein